VWVFQRVWHRSIYEVWRQGLFPFYVPFQHRLILISN
jgi:hypothetical protein